MDFKPKGERTRTRRSLPSCSALDSGVEHLLQQACQALSQSFALPRQATGQNRIILIQVMMVRPDYDHDRLPTVGLARGEVTSPLPGR